MFRTKVLDGHDGQVVEKNVITNRYYLVNNDGTKTKFPGCVCKAPTLGPDGLYLTQSKIISSPYEFEGAMGFDAQMNLNFICDITSEAKAVGNEVVVTSPYFDKPAVINDRVKALLNNTHNSNVITIRENGKFEFVLIYTVDDTIINNEPIPPMCRRASYELTNEDVNHLYNRATQILSMPNGDEKNDAENKLNKTEKMMIQNIGAYESNKKAKDAKIVDSSILDEHTKPNTIKASSEKTTQIQL